MSIHPRYADRILAGSKKVEFRKRPIACDVTHVIIYATAPVSAVVGAFTVASQHVMPPAALWAAFSDVAGIAKGPLLSYFAGREAGVAIEIGAILRTEEPLPLLEALGVRHPPQSYRYVGTHRAGQFLDALAQPQRVPLHP